MLFQFVLFVKLVHNFQDMHTAGICTGKLSFVNNADFITCDHSALTFKSGIGNIKYIGCIVRVQDELVSGKILKGTRKLIHINTVFGFRYSGGIR